MKPLSYHLYRGFPRSVLSQFLSEGMFRYNIRAFEMRASVLPALLNTKNKLTSGLITKNILLAQSNRIFVL